MTLLFVRLARGSGPTELLHEARGVGEGLGVRRMGDDRKLCTSLGFHSQ